MARAMLFFECKAGREATRAGGIEELIRESRPDTTDPLLADRSVPCETPPSGGTFAAVSGMSVVNSKSLHELSSPNPTK